jgi:hypothetical protein
LPDPQREILAGVASALHQHPFPFTEGKVSRIFFGAAAE